mgnify:CR=1 FL=1
MAICWKEWLPRRMYSRCWNGADCKEAGVALEKMKKEASFEECMDTSFGGELEKLEEL